MKNTNWRQDLEKRGAGWAIEEAEKIFNTEIDTPDLDLQLFGFDADSCTYVYEALECLHDELENKEYGN